MATSTNMIGFITLIHVGHAFKTLKSHSCQNYTLLFLRTLDIFYIDGNFRSTNFKNKIYNYTWLYCFDYLIVLQIWLWAIEFLFFISIIRNRYITICHPLKIKWHFSKRSTMYCILGIWVFGSIPSYLWVEFTHVSTNKLKKNCYQIFHHVCI